jgi:hypothetical protein
MPFIEKESPKILAFNDWVCRHRCIIEYRNAIQEGVASMVP